MTIMSSTGWLALAFLNCFLGSAVAVLLALHVIMEEHHFTQSSALCSQILGSMPNTLKDKFSVSETFILASVGALSLLYLALEQSFGQLLSWHASYKTCPS